MKLYQRKLIKIIVVILLLVIILKRFKNFSLSKDFLKNLNILDYIYIILTTSLFFIFLSITLYSIILLKHKKALSNKKNLNLIKEKIIIVLDSYYYKPLKEVDLSIKKILLQKFDYNITDHINKKIKRFYNDTLFKNDFKINNKYFISYFICKYFFKLLVAFIFTLDVLLIKKIYYFYIMMPLLLIPFILQYIKYLLFIEGKTFINKVNKDIEIFDIIPSTPQNLIPTLTLKEYLEKIFPILIQKKDNPYTEIGMSMTWHMKIPLEKKHKEFKWDLIYTRYKGYIRWAEANYIIYRLLSDMEQKYDNYVNVIVFSCYFISWFYIFVNVTFTLYPYELNIILDDNNPFI